MYIKVSTGTSFRNAALYDEKGLSEKQQKQKANKVTFLGGYNLLSTDAAGIAAEMDSVASRSRTEKPVWNVSLSVADGQKLSDAQWLIAVEQYMKEAGADPDRHQVAIWRHADTGRDHVHALINAVPVDGKRALKRYHNGQKAKRAAEKIDVELNQLVGLGRGVKDEISDRLWEALYIKRATNPEELKTDLAELGVVAKYIDDERGIYGAKFQLTDRDHNPIKGSAIKLDGKPASWKKIAVRLEANRAEYEAEIKQLKEDQAEAKKRAEIADKARIEVEIKYDQTRNQPPTVTIKEVVIVKEVPDPADKAEIERLNGELRIVSNSADRYKKLDQMHRQDKDSLIRENEELQRKLQTKEVKHRVHEFYLVTGFDGKALTKASDAEYFVRQAKTNGSIGLISKFLAQDFPNPSTAAVEIENKLQEDYSKADQSIYLPHDLIGEWRKRPVNEKFIKFKTNAESDEWRNTRNDPTLSPPQLQCVKSLEKMKFDGGSGGFQEHQKHQIKY
jgi:hypothetical protein